MQEILGNEAFKKGALFTFWPAQNHYNKSQRKLVPPACGNGASPITRPISKIECCRCPTWPATEWTMSLILPRAKSLITLFGKWLTTIPHIINGTGLQTMGYLMLNTIFWQKAADSDLRLKQNVKSKEAWEGTFCPCCKDHKDQRPSAVWPFLFPMVITPSSHSQISAHFLQWLLVAFGFVWHRVERTFES